MSSVVLNLVTGDDFGAEIQLTRDGGNFRIDSGATVKASLISKDKKSILIDPVDVTRIVTHPDTGVPLSDWVNSKLYPQFIEADTAAIPSTYYNQAAFIELEINDSINWFGKQTWFQKVKILQGTIGQ